MLNSKNLVENKQNKYFVDTPLFLIMFFLGIGEQLSIDF